MRSQPDRILVAQLYGEAKHHAKWRELTADEEAAAVAALRELAGGRADLLAEVAGVAESWIRWAREKAIAAGAVIIDGQVTAVPEPPRRPALALVGSRPEPEPEPAQGSE